MTWLSHGVALALTWFVLVNALASAALAIGGDALVRRIARRAPVQADRLFLAVRLLPFALATGFVLLAFTPSYVLFEPRVGVEEVDLPFATIAVSAVVFIAASIARGWSAWRETNAAVRRFESIGTVIGRRSGADTIAIPVDAPAVLLVGAWRPRLIVTRGLLELLSPRELEVALRHETGHQRALDNLKRLAMRGVPDLWSWTPAARRVEQAWAAAAERAADRAASSEGRADALALASAIVKVAQRTAAAPLLPCASLLVDGADVTSRVHALLEDSGVRPRERQLPIGALLLLAAAAFLMCPPVIAAVHEASEVLVRLL